MSHYMIKCKDCGDIMEQCRCPSNDKSVTFGHCDKCKAEVLKRRKHPSLIVLEALLMGLEVDLAGLDIMMDEEYNLTIPAYDHEGNLLENRRLNVDYGPLGAFIHGCELIEEDALMLIVADITMNKMRRGK